MELWICLQFVRGVYDYRIGEWEKGHQVFEFAGVFDSEEKAVAACRDENYYIFPSKLNERLPHETIPDNGYYPLAKKES